MREGVCRPINNPRNENKPTKHEERCRRRSQRVDVRENSKEVRKFSSGGDCSNERLRVCSKTDFGEIERGGMDLNINLKEAYILFFNIKIYINMKVYSRSISEETYC